MQNLFIVESDEKESSHYSILFLISDIRTLFWPTHPIQQLLIKWGASLSLQETVHNYNKDTAVSVLLLDKRQVIPITIEIMAITITSYWFLLRTTKNSQIRPKEAEQQPIYWLVWINRFCKFEIGWHYWNQWSKKIEWIYPTGATSTTCWKDKRWVISGPSNTQ